MFSLLLFALPALAKYWTAPGGILFGQPTGVHLTFVEVTMKVPPVPPNDNEGETLFIWPGISPGAGDWESDPQKIGNGVLQPVLTFGSSCAPASPKPYGQWWISGMYVNTGGSNPNYSGCYGGSLMPLNAGELVTCTMTVAPGTTKWTQNCTRSAQKQSVSFTIDLQGQLQNQVELYVEPPTEKSVKLWNFPVYFYDFKFTADNPMPSEDCLVPELGDQFITQNSTLSTDKKTCSLGALGFWNYRNGSPPIKSIPPKQILGTGAPAQAIMCGQDTC